MSTVLVIPSCLLIGGLFAGPNGRLLEETEAWLAENIKNGWKYDIMTTAHQTEPSSWRLDDDEYSIALDVKVFEPAIWFESENEALLFKMRWF